MNKKLILFLSIIFIILILINCPVIHLNGRQNSNNNSVKSGIEKFDISGEYTWIPEYNCTAVVTVIGAGGGGGCADGLNNGEGGLSGEVIKNRSIIFLINKNESYNIVVGNGGQGSKAAFISGENGELSSVMGISASGGNGGKSADSSISSIDRIGKSNDSLFGTGGDGGESGFDNSKYNGKNGQDGYVEIKWTKK